MTTLMDPDDHRLHQQPYHDYVYVGYADSRFQILKKGKLLVVLPRSLAIPLTSRLLGISARTVCLNFSVRAESTTKSQPLQRRGNVGG